MTELDDPRRRRWLGVTVLVTVALAGLALVLKRRFYFYDDTQIGAFWNWWEVGTSLRNGRWPMLDPSRWMAGNVGAEGQWGVWNPLVLLISLGASFASNAALYATIVKVGFLVGAAAGTHLVVRDRDVPSPIASVAGVAVTLTGFTVYMDSASWVTGLMTFALLPWAWLTIVRLGDGRGGVLAPFVACYLLVSVGYVHGTVMLAVTFAAVIVARLVGRDRAGALRVVGCGALVGLVTVTVYLPSLLTANVTARSQDGVLNSDALSTDLSGLVASVSSEARSVLPGFWAGNYAPVPLVYIAWFLPVLAFVDWGAARRLWRRHLDVLILLGVSALLVLGPSDMGPLRFPIRLIPYLALGVLVVVAVVLTGALASPLSRSRLGAAIAWIVIATYLAWSGQPSTLGLVLLAGVIAVAGLVVTRRTLDRAVIDGRRWELVAAVLLGFSALTTGLQRWEHRASPLPDFGLPPSVDALRDVQSAAVSDVIVVGTMTPPLGIIVEPPEVHVPPGMWTEALLGNAWRGADVVVQNTYTPVAFATYAELTCMNFRGETCSDLLRRLFSPQPTTGLDLVDQLAINSIVLIKEDVGDEWRSPPSGWELAADGTFTATWIRRSPGPRAGGVVWASDGVAVTEINGGDTYLQLRVDQVPADGGTVVLSRLAWPGYTASNATIGDPTDGYLVTVEVPAEAAGETVAVRFRPPGWRTEVGSLALALFGVAAWTATDTVRRRRSGPGASREAPVHD